MRLTSLFDGGGSATPDYRSVQDAVAFGMLNQRVGIDGAKSEDPADKPSDHGFDHLKLQTDGKYEIVQGGSSKPRSENAGSWHFIGRDSSGMLFRGNSAEVDSDNSGYPVTVKGNEIRLMIDYDTGIWREKEK